MQPTEIRKSMLDSDRLVKALPLRFVALVVLSYGTEIALTNWMAHLVPNIGPAFEMAFQAFALSFAICVFTFLLVVKPLIRALRKEQAVAEKQTLKLHEEMTRQQFDASLYRALEMVESESDMLRVFQRTLWCIGEESSVALLLADSSQAHLRMVARYAPEGFSKAESLPAPDATDTPADALPDPNGQREICLVGVPRQCVAARQGRMLHFEDSEAIDACPFIIAEADRPVNVACVPISIAGQTVGVLQAGSPRERPINSSMLAKLEIIAVKFGARLGLIRAMTAAELAATTDPLTGLLNRRSLSVMTARLIAQRRDFSVILADLDDFKKLNDTYGHVVGDQTLKLFARALKENCRGDDVVARFGGEEFVVVVPDVVADKVVSILERVRSRLPNLQMQSGIPSFTASYGIADVRHATTFEGIVKLADAAMYEAKAAGKNRIVVASLLRRGDTADCKCPEQGCAGSSADSVTEVSALVAESTLRELEEKQ